MKTIKKVAAYLALLGGITSIPGGEIMAGPIVEPDFEPDTEQNTLPEQTVKDTTFRGTGGDTYISLDIATEQMGLDLGYEGSYVTIKGTHAQTGDYIVAKIEPQRQKHNTRAKLWRINCCLTGFSGCSTESWPH